jgi:DNA-directed RNA polymerase specialized sigma24 family protein
VTDAGRRLGRQPPGRSPATDSRDEALLAEVRRTNHLLAVLAVKGMEQRQAIAFLDTAGFRAGDIATAIGITRNAVNIALHRMRKLADSGTAIEQSDQQAENTDAEE